MDKVTKYINNRGAQLYLYAMGLIFTGVIAYEIIINTPISAAATGYVALVIGYAINSHGVSQGVDSSNDVVAKTAAAQQPLVNSQAASNSRRIKVLEDKENNNG